MKMNPFGAMWKIFQKGLMKVMLAIMKDTQILINVRTHALLQALAVPPAKMKPIFSVITLVSVYPIS